MTEKLAFIDTETTSLRPDRRVWEIAVIVREPDLPDREFAAFVRERDLDLGNADPMSLRIGRFYERHPDFEGRKPVRTGPNSAGGFSVAVADTPSELEVLKAVERMLRGAIIVGAVPNFDTEVLAARMRANGICPSWHYHLVDVETLAAGALTLRPRWDFDEVLAAFGLVYDEADRHTALGDARMVRDLYDAVMRRENAVTTSPAPEPRPQPTTEPGPPTGTAGHVSVDLSIVSGEHAAAPREIEQ